MNTFVLRWQQERVGTGLSENANLLTRVIQASVIGPHMLLTFIDEPVDILLAVVFGKGFRR